MGPGVNLHSSLFNKWLQFLNCHISSIDSISNFTISLYILLLSYQFCKTRGKNAPINCQWFVFRMNYNNVNSKSIPLRVIIIKIIMIWWTKFELGGYFYLLTPFQNFQSRVKTWSCKHMNHWIPVHEDSITTHSKKKEHCIQHVCIFKCYPESVEMLSWCYHQMYFPVAHSNIKKGKI